MKTTALAGRPTLAGVLTAFLLLVAFAVTAVGYGQYLEDYCLTRVDVPREVTGGRGVIPEGLVTYRCQWDGAPDLTLTDPAPLGWVFLVSSAAGVVAAWTWWGVVIHPRRAALESGRRVWARSSVGVSGLLFTAMPAGWMFVWAWSPTPIQVAAALPLLLPAGLLAFAGTWLGTDGTKYPTS